MTAMSIKNISIWGILISLSLVLGFLESLLPSFSSVPGIKIGLSNLTVLICLYLYGGAGALVLSLAKAVLTGFLFGSASSIIYSVCGAVLSCIAMILLKKIKVFHLPVISGVGAVMHNVGQLLVAYLVIGSAGVLYYLPVLIITGLIMGFVIGGIAALSLPSISKIINKGINL